LIGVDRGVEINTGQPVGCQKWITSRDQVVFVNDAAEHISAADVTA